MKNYKEISEKSVNTKNNTVVDGKNMHQISAERSAKTTADRYTKEEISSYIREGQTRYYKSKRLGIDKRIDAAIERYGIIKFVKLLTLYAEKIPKFHKFYRNYLVKRINEDRVKLLESMFENGIEEFFFVHIKNRQYRCTCPVCYSIFINYDEVPKVTCSKSCTSKYNYILYPDIDKKISKSLGLRYQNPEESRKTSDALKKSHSEKTIEEKKEWSTKMLNTMGIQGRMERGASIKRTRIARGQVVPDEKLEEFELYKRKVRSLTNRADLSTLEFIELRGRESYHLDHIYPTKQGFLNNVPPELISDIRNLRMLPSKNNLTKSDTIEYIPDFIEKYLNETNENN